MSKSEPYHLHRAIGYQLSLTARLQERGFEAKLKSLALTRISWCILLAVETENLRNPSSIADFVGVDRTATSRALRNMARANLIERNEEEADGRRTSVVATEYGRALLHQASQAARENAAHFEAKLTSTEQTNLRNILQKLQSGEGSPLAHL